jgi:tetratricopeptide (TPR) repeat protein
MISIRIYVLSFCLLLLLCVTVNATSANKNNPKTAYDFYLSGTGFYHDGRYDRAITVLGKSVELDPDYYYARINLGIALAKTRQFRKAAQEFTFCIDRKWGSKSDRFVFYLNRALAADAAGDKGSALKDRAALEKLDPIRAGRVGKPADYILMDPAYVEKRNQADRDKLLAAHKKSIVSGKVIIHQVAKLEKNKQEYEAIGLIAGTLKQVSGVLADYANYPKFMPDVEEITVRSSSDGGTIVDHKLGLPLGFVKKYRLKFHSRNEQGRAQMFWKKLPWPEIKARQTVVDTYGQWILEDFPDKQGHVLAYYRVYTDIGKVPLGTRWIVDALTSESIENIFKGTRRRIRDIYH